MMKKLTLTRKPEPAPMSQRSDNRDPNWVAKMHTHYQQTGVYRAEDLNRVLGDPRKQVSGETSDFAIACRAVHK
jgi:hypothetical protein